MSLSGVQASVASVVSATASPEELTIHIIVQAQSLNTFKAMINTDFDAGEPCVEVVCISRCS